MTKRVLVCDDEPDIRELLKMLLEMEFSAEVVEAENGEAGIIAIQESGEEFDLILCDMHMPKQDGLAVFEHNKKAKNIPFVLMSGSSGDKVTNLQNLFDANSKNSLLAKPWLEGDLFSILNKAFAD